MIENDKENLNINETKMKICILFTAFFERAGGMYTYVRTIKEKLQEKGHEVHILASRIGYKEGKEENIHKVFALRLYPLSLIESLTFSFSSFLKLYSLDKNHDFDVVYCMGGTYCALLPLIKKVIRKPVVIHTPSFSKYNFIKIKNKRPGDYIHYLPLIPVEKLAFSKADQIITVANIFREEISNLYGIDKNRISVIPNGVDVPVLNLGSSNYKNRTRLREKYGINSKDMVYMFVGRSKEKGLYEVIKAFDMIKLKHKKLIVVGKSYNEIESKLHTGNENMICREFVPRSTLNDLYRAADVFVFPSYYPQEGQPFVVLEAMSYGLPIITTNRRGMLDQVDDGLNGFFVPPQNLSELAKKMELIARKDYRKMGELSKQKALKCFSWSYVVDKTVETFRRIKSSYDTKKS